MKYHKNKSQSHLIYQAASLTDYIIFYLFKAVGKVSRTFPWEKFPRIRMNEDRNQKLMEPHCFLVFMESLSM